MEQSFSIAKKGYDPHEVDKFIEELEREISSFKMKEQYISQALVEAQVTSKKIIEQSEIRAFQLEKNALLRLEHLKHEIHHTRERLNGFQNDYTKFIDKFTQSFSNNELAGLFNTLAELATTLDKNIDKEKTHKADEAVTDPLAVMGLKIEGSDFEY